MHQEDPNKITIDSYNNDVDAYLKNTPATYTSQHLLLIKWIDEVLSFTKPGGSILEIGSATPRDAKYMRSKGFTVQCSDAAPNFVEHLNELGESALLLNLAKDSIPGKYDAIFANAVFPHFTPEDISHALGVMYDALNDGGIISFNVKQGVGTEWVEEKHIGKRFVHYWEPHEIYALVNSCEFSVVSLEDGIGGDLPTHVWTRIIAKKEDCPDHLTS